MSARSNFARGPGLPGQCWSVCGRAVSAHRLARAAAQSSHPAANRTPDLYRHVPDVWEPIDGPRLVIDTDATLDSGVNQAMHYLVERDPLGRRDC